jgi:hypothetical protein
LTKGGVEDVGIPTEEDGARVGPGCVLAVAVEETDDKTLEERLIVGLDVAWLEDADTESISEDPVLDD